MSAFYNENDPKAAAWLRELIRRGLIADGVVDERSIVDVRVGDLRGFAQCHFFAGIGVWSYALHCAGWLDDRPVWTGSCPCQPFSAAGRSGGFDDGRHLWPHWSRLIGECGPDVVFGEQVASADGLAWLDFVCADLEAAGYAVGALDTCAAGFGAPHIRQRLYFVADANQGGRARSRQARTGVDRGMEAWATGSNDDATPPHTGGTGAVADAAESRSERARQYEGGPSPLPARSAERGEPSDMGDADLARPQGRRERAGSGAGECAARTPSADGGNVGDSEGRGLGVRWSTSGGGGRPAQPSATNGFWSSAEWLSCTDGKARPVEPGTFPLAHGAAERVGRLRGYGNAIVAPQAEEFVRAYIDVTRQRISTAAERRKS